MQKITPFLWFDGQAEEAADFYTSILRDSKVLETLRYGDAGPGPKGSVMTVRFLLQGQEFVALNGGPEYKFNPSISFVINCDSQEEADFTWEKLTDGGHEVQCGWLTDRYGLSWQVIPAGFMELIGDPDPARSQRAMRAMFGMKKLDVNALRKAADDD